MDYFVTGFTQDKDVRIFTFRGFADGKAGPTQYTVRADLTATRKHGIAQQDLPVLCRNLLARHQPPSGACLTFTDDELQAIEEERILSHAAVFRKSNIRTSGKALI